MSYVLRSLSRILGNGGGDEEHGVVLEEKGLQHSYHDRGDDFVTLNHFKNTLHAVESGDLPFRKLLYEMGRLDAELPGPVVSRLFRYLSRDRSIMKLIEFLLLEEEDESQEDARARKIYSYVASNALAHGPTNMISSLCMHDHALDVLLNFFKTEEVLDPQITLNVCRVLYAGLDVKPMRILRRLLARQGSLKNFVHHISHEGVAELLTHLVEARDSVQNFTQVELDQGRMVGIRLYFVEHIFDLLSSKFVDSSAVAEKSFLANEEVDNICYVISALAMRFRNEIYGVPAMVHYTRLVPFIHPEPVQEILKTAVKAAEVNGDTQLLQVALRLSENILRTFPDYGSIATEPDYEALVPMEVMVHNFIPSLLGLLKDSRLAITKLEISFVEKIVMEGVYSSLLESFTINKVNSLMHTLIVAGTKALLVRGTLKTIEYIFTQCNLMGKIIALWKEDSGHDGRAGYPAQLASVIDLALIVEDCVTAADPNGIDSSVLQNADSIQFDEFLSTVLREVKTSRAEEDHSDSNEARRWGRVNVLPEALEGFVGTPQPEAGRFEDFPQSRQSRRARASV